MMVREVNTSIKNELVHEIWLDPEPDGQLLPRPCLAGPMGGGSERSLIKELLRLAR